jgi:hypothetical protein
MCHRCVDLKSSFTWPITDQELLLKLKPMSKVPNMKIEKNHEVRIYLSHGALEGTLKSLDDNGLVLETSNYETTVFLPHIQAISYLKRGRKNE